jgi:major intracellular serine protease
MIPVKIIKAIYIRKGPGVSFGYLGVIYPSGNEINMAGTVAGESYKGINTWYYLVNDNGVKQYYWAGGISVITTPQEEAPGGALPAAQPEVTPIQPETPARQSFPWFDNLGVKNIWATYKATGHNAIVAVLDTGYNINNADVAAAVTASGLFFEGEIPGDTIDDIDGHGTFSTSIVGARNKRTYNIGIAPDCSILSGKISLTKEPFSVGKLLDAIKWAIDNKADVISISFSIDLTDQAAINAFQSGLTNILNNKNVLVFASCGNSASGQIFTREVYPASLSGCVSVGASDGSDIAGLTIRSAKTIIHAQGVQVAAYTLAATPQPLDGTSVSTPIVAGIAALAVSYLKAKNGGVWQAQDLLQKIYDTATPVAGNPLKKIINPVALFQKL